MFRSFTNQQRGIVNFRRTGNEDPNGLASSSTMHSDSGVLNEEFFHRMLSIERKRTERSRKPFLLMLIDTGDSLPPAKGNKVLCAILHAMTGTTRETDIKGWYKANSVVGVMFTEITVNDRNSVVAVMYERVVSILRHSDQKRFNQICISFHLFPEDWDQEISHRPSNPVLYPDLTRRDNSRKFLRFTKRFIDLTGALLVLIAFSPLFLLIAIAVKLSSKGPILFRQYRIGQYGVPFMFLKFRSMYTDNDASTHKEYVRKWIQGQAEGHSADTNGRQVYKMTNDSRVTAVGNLLRRTSFDELPQFFNVLKGDMSLVGPRPPIPYEVEAYEVWHRRRLLEVKPGITGLWQVNGRSRLTFDDMVRLDLRYAERWSPWLDIKILLRTPWAVVQGEGAY